MLDFLQYMSYFLTEDIYILSENLIFRHPHLFTLELLYAFPVLYLITRLQPLYYDFQNLFPVQYNLMNTRLLILIKVKT